MTTCISWKYIRIYWHWFTPSIQIWRRPILNNVVLVSMASLMKTKWIWVNTFRIKGANDLSDPGSCRIGPVRQVAGPENATIQNLAALHGVFWMGTAHYVAAHCNALVQPRSRFHPLYSPQKALNWGGGRAWHKALNKFFKLPSHHLCSGFFPAKRASIEFGSCLHLLWLPSPNPDNSVGQNQVFDFLFVFLRVCEYHICVFACLWILHLCFACLWIWDLCICVCKIIIFVYLPSTTSPSKARQPCRRPLHVQGRTGCIKSILGSKGATKPMAWVAFSTRFISKGLGGQVFRRLEHKRGDLVLW